MHRSLEQAAVGLLALAAAVGPACVVEAGMVTAGEDGCRHTAAGRKGTEPLNTSACPMSVAPTGSAAEGGLAIAGLDVADADGRRETAITLVAPRLSPSILLGRGRPGTRWVLGPPGSEGALGPGRRTPPVADLSSDPVRTQYSSSAPSGVIFVVHGQ